MVMRGCGLVMLCGLVAACSVSARSEGTGGVPDATFGAPEAGPSTREDAAVPSESGEDAATTHVVCPRLLLVASSDYMSTNISVLAPSGAPISTSLISSGSAPPGLTTALSGDVVFPSAPPTSGSLVLIDRFPNSVLTWIDPATATVQRQLSVATGFVSNPQDYLEVAPDKAYVSRYETNSKAGQEPNDGGGDLLIINPTTGDITGRIDMATSTDGEILPRPGQLLRIRDQVWVALARTSARFDKAGDARLVGVDVAGDAVAWSLDLPGAVGCNGMAMSPSGHVVALACASLLGEPDAPAKSAVILLDVTTQPPSEKKRISTASLGAPLGSPLAFVSETVLLGIALGDGTAGRNDVAFTLDTTAETAAVVATSGAPFSFGDVRCAPGCTDRCVLADASAKALRVWTIDAGALVPAASLPVDPVVDLPPRSLGAL